MSNPSDEIDDLIARTDDWRGAAFARLRKVILDAAPGITEEIKWRKPSNPAGAPVWEHNGIICVGNILKGSVRLTFPAGASLPDPQKLFNTRLDSKTARAIDFFEGDKLDETALRALIRSGVEHNLAKTKPAQAAGP